MVTAGTMGAGLLGPAMVGLVAVLIAGLAVRHVRADRRRQGPALRRLGRAVGLGPGELRLLERVAREAGLPVSASLLVSRGCFDHAAGVFRARFRDGGRLGAIRSRVFAEDGPHPR